MTKANDLHAALRQAVARGDLLESALENLTAFLEAGVSEVARASVRELVANGDWGELNDRFFRTLTFGTGGLRGRSIGRKVTEAERGTPRPDGRPEFPCAGTNTLNEYNITRAARGLVEHVLAWWGAQPGRPRIVIAHDSRFFSAEFAERCAEVATLLGCDAYLFDGPRSTPELSFAVRHLRAQAGIVLTASHNPPHDNGFKCYFRDGAQVVEPHASGIIERVNAIRSATFDPQPLERRGVLHRMGSEVDEAYLDRLQTLVLEPELLRGGGGLKVVYSPIHGTGGIIVRPMLERLGVDFVTVPEQDLPDGRFPTVQSPNPENAEALTLAMRLADEVQADLVLATDPDCDRMGAAVRTASGKLKLLTGNQIGSLIAHYRVTRLKKNGTLNDENRQRAVLIKTFVTTDLLKAIAQHHGISCVETLTGFKYIGEKLTRYEEAIPAEFRRDYAALDEAQTRALRLQYSRFYVCGGEESYGYSGADFVRDKDGNGAVAMFVEVAAWARSRGLTLDDLMDEVYTLYGFHAELNGSLTFEGAEGATRIRRLVESYATRPPTHVDGSKAVSVRDFARDILHDSEGVRVPKEPMLMVDLADGRRFAVRPSGTEPKIKYYLFGRRLPAPGARLTTEELGEAKAQVTAGLDRLWSWLQADAEARIAA